MQKLFLHLLILFIGVQGTLRQLCYISTATHELSNEELNELLVVSRRNNQYRQITGVLLYKAMSFVQIVEGPDDALKELLYTLTLDSRHKGIIVMFNKEIPQREFSSWTLASRFPLRNSDADDRYANNDFSNYLDAPNGVDQPLSRYVQILLRRFEQIM
jgi:hypothetical protein